VLLGIVAAMLVVIAAGYSLHEKTPLPTDQPAANSGPVDR